MRTYVVSIATVVAVAIASGCSGADGERSGDPRPGTGTSQPGEPDAPGASDVPVVDSEACEEVRTGIAAFNRGDYPGTVEHFEAAVPLAVAQDDGTERAAQLIEAVRYYAELDAGLYPEASRSSADFAKYKAITLGQCMPVGGEDPESPGTDV